jgi:hypothetical protein
MRRPRYVIQLAAVLVTAAIAACTGGSTTYTPLGPAATQSGTTSTTSNTSLPAASSGGITAAVVLPPASGSTGITETVNRVGFSGAPALSLARRAASGSRSPQAVAQPLPVLYLEFVSTGSVTLNGTPGVTFTLPSITAGQQYFLAAYGSNGWNYPVAGPGTVSGSTVSFPIGNGTAVTISPAAPLIVALYTAGGPGISPALLTFGVSNPSTASFTVTEPGDTAAFTASIACTAATPSPTPTPTQLVADVGRLPQTVQPTPTPTPSASPFVAQLDAASATPTNGVATFAVTSGNELGTCTVTVTDSQSFTVTGGVAVDATNLSVESVHQAAAQGVH